MNPIIVTGASGSMGAAAVREMASRGCPVIMACRNLAKGEGIRSKILAQFPDASIELLQLNLDTMAGVDAFVDELKGRKLAGIFNNAGVISREFSLTEDGVEHTMAVNFINPALLTIKLLPQFEQNAHVVNMVSLTTKLCTLDKDWLKYSPSHFNRLKVYSKTKLALLLFTCEFSRRHPELIVNVSDPGVVDSNMITMGKWFDPLADLFFRPFISSPQTGVAPALRALQASRSLDYYVGGQSRTIPKRFLSNPLGADLYEYVSSLN